MGEALFHDSASSGLWDQPVSQEPISKEGESGAPGAEPEGSVRMEIQPVLEVSPWIAKLIHLADQDLPPTINRQQINGRTFYEHCRYPGALVDIQVYDPLKQSSSETDQQCWFATQWIRHEVEYGPIPLLHNPPDDPLPEPGTKVVDAVKTEQQEEQGQAPAKTKWQGGIRLRYRAVPTAFVHVITGEVVFADTATQAGNTSYPTLLEILQSLPPEIERVYLVGPRPGREGNSESLYLWLRDPAVGREWESIKFEPDDDNPILELREREPGNENKKREVRISRVAQWFGPGSYTPKQAQEAMEHLERILQATFDENMRCLTTPGLTGLAAWDRSRKVEYPILSDEIQALIRSTGPQGRVEITPVAGRDPLPAFYYTDGRFMYGSLLRGIGFGPVVHDDAPEFDRVERGRYRVKFRIPRDWRHVGLFPIRPDRPHDPWSYPSEPGYEGETWVGSSELALALNPPKGLPAWNIEIKERLLFQSGSKGHPWPLDTWGDHLIDARMSIERRVAEGEFSSEVGELLENGLRNIVLHALGGFHRRNRAEVRLVYPHEGFGSIPADADPVFHNDGTATYSIFRPLEKWIARLMHPEFSAQVWSKCRTHLLYSAKKKMGQVVPGSESGILLLDRKDIVGLRTDAAYITCDPRWPDDGKTPGQFRLKGKLDEPCPQPDRSGQGHKLLNRLRDKSRQAWLGTETLVSVVEDER